MLMNIGTITKGAALLHQEGAREVYACCTHAVLRYTFSHQTINLMKFQHRFCWDFLVLFVSLLLNYVFCYLCYMLKISKFSLSRYFAVHLQ